MCKKNGIAIGFKGSTTNTNLSLAITGADTFVEGANTQYTASLTLSGVIGSPTTVLTVTLPAGITYVSSSDSGSHNAGVITWTLGSLMANKNVTFTINSATPAPEYTVTGQVTSGYANLGTTSASKDIEVEASGGGTIDIIIQNAWFGSNTVTSVGPYIDVGRSNDNSGAGFVDITADITISQSYLGDNKLKIGTILEEDLAVGQYIFTLAIGINGDAVFFVASNFYEYTGGGQIICLVDLS